MIGRTVKHQLPRRVPRDLSAERGVRSSGWSAGDPGRTRTCDPL